MPKALPRTQHILKRIAAGRKEVRSMMKSSYTPGTKVVISLGCTHVGIQYGGVFEYRRGTWHFWGIFRELSLYVPNKNGTFAHLKDCISWYD